MGGEIFIILLKMLVVPIVFSSLVAGICNLGDTRQFGQLATKTFALYLVTTTLAITAAISFADLLQVGAHHNQSPINSYTSENLPSLKTTFIDIFPSNPFASLAKGHMLQIILFAILLGLAINRSGEAGKRTKKLFDDFNVVIMKLMLIVIRLAPFGVFCLVSAMFSKVGLHLISQLFAYFASVAAMLCVQLFIIYPVFLKFVGHAWQSLFKK